MRFGRRLALDVGKARIGVAMSDPHGILGSPVGNLLRQESIKDSVDSWIDFLRSNPELADSEFLELYVGLPINLKGDDTLSTSDAIEIGIAFAEAAKLPLRFIDERLTTVAAAAGLRASGKNSKQGRGLIDAVAASLILEAALAQERNSGTIPGKTVDEVRR